MKMKLLSPAGDMASLRAAVYAGADEVYLGVKDFNARNIEGFNLSSLKDAVIFAHIFGVKVHLTVNILFTDEELGDALKLVVDAYNIGVDAFIVQDIGLAYLIHKYYPQIVVHASTQMGIHNLEGVRQAEKLGIKRVVLARETPLDEIENIHKNSKVEIEYFVHGALCVSFSGNCYLSSYKLGLSGNRGKCKQLCRLPYKMMFNGKTVASGNLLSAKDICMLNNLRDLERAGVTSLKIEGRARRPYYVYTATKYYRSALDGEINKDLTDLKIAFNRDFTPAYFDGNGKIISKHAANIGAEIGKIVKINSGKKFDEVVVESNYKVSAESSFKIFENGKEIAVVSPFDIRQADGKFSFTTTTKLKVGQRVNIILDAAKEKEILALTKRRQIDVELLVVPNKNITATFKVDSKKYTPVGDVVEQAKSQPITERELRENFNKSELFDVNLKITTSNAFIVKSKLNAFRRKVLDEIYAAYETNKNLKFVEIDEKFDVKPLKNAKIIKNLADFGTIKEEIVIYSPQEFLKDDIKKFVDNCQNLNKQPYLNLPVYVDRDDLKLLDDILSDTRLGIVVNNLYGFKYPNKKIAGAGLNIYNKVSAQYFDSPYMVAENTLMGDITKMPYMTLKHCPFKNHLNANCTACPYKDGYTYKMPDGTTFKLTRTKLNSCTFYLTD